jgi:hypothetical protein
MKIISLNFSFSFLKHVKNKKLKHNRISTQIFLLGPQHATVKALSRLQYGLAIPHEHNVIVIVSGRKEKKKKRKEKKSHSPYIGVRPMQ